MFCSMFDMRCWTRVTPQTTPCPEQRFHHNLLSSVPFSMVWTSPWEWPRGCCGGRGGAAPGSEQGSGIMGRRTQPATQRNGGREVITWNCALHFVIVVWAHSKLPPNQLANQLLSWLILTPLSVCQLVHYKVCEDCRHSHLAIFFSFWVRPLQWDLLFLITSTLQKAWGREVIKANITHYCYLFSFLTMLILSPYNQSATNSFWYGHTCSRYSFGSYGLTICCQGRKNLDAQWVTYFRLGEARFQT